MLAAFAPSGRLAVACLLSRSLLSQLDVPARQSYVMSVVEPSERAAAAAYTNVPRSLATASTPALAGWMLGHSTFGWPLLVGGALKAGYDLALLHQFGRTDGERGNDGGGNDGGADVGARRGGEVAPVTGPRARRPPTRPARPRR
jgi:MFS family permease